MAPVALSPDQETTLLDAAIDAIGHVLEHGRERDPDRSLGGDEVAPGDDALRAFGASFVTLERDTRLLGCIGTLEPVRPLVVDVAHNAVAAAFRDPRLPPVSRGDYVEMAVEISVLSPLRPLAVGSYDELATTLVRNDDGLLVESDRHRATFLPAVWRHFDGDADAFLEALWRKAGLAPRAWPAGIRLARYRAAKLVDPGPRRPPTTG